MADPRIITAHGMGLTFKKLFGDLGPELHITGHYGADRRARDFNEGIAKARSYHEYHKSKGWGGIAYHYLIPDDGALICARPTRFNGAHVGGHNSNNVGVVVPGTTGDRPTRRQIETFAWLLANAHKGAMPREHRADRDLRKAKRWVHSGWPGQATSCPGAFAAMFLGRRLTAAEYVPVEETEPMPGSGIEVEDTCTAAEVEVLFPPEEAYGETIADFVHVSPGEADAALNPRDVEEELPEPDPEFDQQEVVSA